MAAAGPGIGTVLSDAGGGGGSSSSCAITVAAPEASRAIKAASAVRRERVPPSGRRMHHTVTIAVREDLKCSHSQSPWVEKADRKPTGRACFFNDTKGSNLNQRESTPFRISACNHSASFVTQAHGCMSPSSGCEPRLRSGRLHPRFGSSANGAVHHPKIQSSKTDHGHCIFYGGLRVCGQLCCQLCVQALPSSAPCERRRVKASFSACFH